KNSSMSPPVSSSSRRRGRSMRAPAVTTASWKRPPVQAIEKSLAGEGLLAHVVVSKYLDHLPLHRLEGIFLRQGVALSRSTLWGWVADVARARAPIGDQLRREITAASYLQTDDTSVTVLDEHGGSFKGAAVDVSGSAPSTSRFRCHTHPRA